MKTSRVLGLLIAGLGLLWSAPAQRTEIPIFDAHIHYSQPDWDSLSPKQVLAILSQAGVQRAIVSSTPDEGTLKLYLEAPTRVVPFLRPYRTRADMTTWHSDPAVQAYIEERIKRGIYRGIGEFHLSSSDVGGPVVKRCAELSAQQGLFLQAHVDDETVEKMLTLYPRAKILWAHAGMSASASTVGRLLERYPNLWVELALRTDVASNGVLDPQWKAVFVRHADRIMVGTDTWVTSRWDSLVGGMREVRRWLAQLPPEVAEKIAYKNGERLFVGP